jgi:hypothetical protein
VEGVAWLAVVEHSRRVAGDGEVEEERGGTDFFVGVDGGAG